MQSIPSAVPALCLTAPVTAICRQPNSCLALIRQTAAFRVTLSNWSIAKCDSRSRSDNSTSSYPQSNVVGSNSVSIWDAPRLHHVSCN